MPDKRQPREIRFGANAHIKVGRDFVMGDKTENISHSKTYSGGFQDEVSRKQFQTTLDEMREALRAIQIALATSPSLTPDQKDDAAAAIAGQTVDLKKVKESVAALPPDKKLQPDLGAAIEKSLTRATGIIETLGTMGTKANDLTDKLADFAKKYGPLVLTARHLFGLS